MRQHRWRLLILVFMVALIARMSHSPVRAQAGDGANMFGVMPAGSPELKVSIAQELRVPYLRVGDVNTQHQDWESCPECDAVNAAGLALILTVRNGGGAGVPSTPPADLPAYRATIASILARYRPALLVVENEENDQQYFYDGTPQQYLEELSVACGASHDAHISCTNGGLVSKLVAFLVANHLNDLGETDRALDYLRRTLRPEDYQNFIDSGADFQSPEIEDRIQRGMELAGGYRSSGADYLNFHWYAPDPTALRDAVLFLRQVSGLPALTNEVGQQGNENPAYVADTLDQILALQLPYAMWFSRDVTGAGNARALTDPDGTLRPNGIAFRQFMIDHFELTPTPTPVGWTSQGNQLLVGDVNNDNTITIEDVALVSSLYTDFSVPVPVGTPEDVNNDQRITIDDLALTLLHWNDFAVSGDE